VNGVVRWGRSARRDFILRDLFTYAKYSGMCPDINEEEYGDVCAFLESCLPNTPRLVEWKIRTGRMTTKPGRFSQQFNDFQMPRGTFKTSLIKALCSYAQELDEDIRIVLGRATTSMAEKTLSALKDDLTRNPSLVEIFGNIRARYSTWTTTQIIRNDRAPGIKEPTVDTTGLGQSQTGQHPDFVVLDDLVHEGNYESVPDMYSARETVDAYDPILTSWGSLLLVGTRWGDNDIHGYVMERDRDLEEKGKAPKFRHFILGAFIQSRDPAIDGKPRFPTALPEEFLALKRDNTDPKKFASWYLNSVRAEGEDIFTLAYIQHFDGQFVPGAYAQLILDESDPLRAKFGRSIPLVTVMTIDPSLTVGPKSDFTGLVVTGFDNWANYWVLHADEFKQLPTDRLVYILDLCHEYDPAIIAIENADIEASLLQEKLRSMGLRGVVVRFDPRADRKRITSSDLTPRGMTGKKAQIEAMEPTLRARRVFFARGTTAPLVRRLQAYPYVDHDDVLDAFSMSKVYEQRATNQVLTDPIRISMEIERREYALEGMDFDGRPLGAPRGTGPIVKPGAWAGR
jgi:hypothetical protein